MIGEQHTKAKFIEIKFKRHILLKRKINNQKKNLHQHHLLFSTGKHHVLTSFGFASLSVSISRSTSTVFLKASSAPWLAA
jgi:hypothetical protein